VAGRATLDALLEVELASEVVAGVVVEAAVEELVAAELLTEGLVTV